MTEILERQATPKLNIDVALTPVCAAQTGASALRLIAACITSGSYCGPVP